MDYKELIGQLYRLSRTRDALIHTEMSFACAEAADTIETLLAERDAAVADLISACESLPICAACQYCKNYPCSEKMNDECEDGLSQFEWKGPQKGEPHGE